MVARRRVRPSPGPATVARLPALLIAAVVLVGCQTGGADGETGSTRTATGTQAARAEVASADARADGAVAAAHEGVTVTGVGEASAEPDTLRATVGVHVVRPDVETAFDDAAAAADRVLAAVREHGVADEDVQTRELSVRPEHEPRPEEPPRITGYAVTNLVEVTIRDVDAAGELLASVADAAGDDARIEGLRFSLAEDDAVLEQARQEAFEDARRKADHYAQLAGLSLGDLVSITEAGGQAPPPARLSGEAVADAGGAAPPVMPGQQQIRVQLTATWSLR